MYHHSSSEGDTYVLLHSTKPRYSAVDLRIRQLETPVGSHTANDIHTMDRTNASRDMLCRDPYRLHLLFFSSYLDNWRRYLQYIGQCYAEEV